MTFMVLLRPSLPPLPRQRVTGCLRLGVSTPRPNLASPGSQNSQDVMCNASQGKTTPSKRTHGSYSVHEWRSDLWILTKIA